MTVDPMISEVFQILREDPAQVEDNGIQEFLDGIEFLTTTAREAMTNISGFAESMHDAAKWSKDLRKPSARIERALRQVVDAGSVFAEWRSETDQLRALSAGQAISDS